MEKDTVDLQVMSWKRGQNDCKIQRPGRTGANRVFQKRQNQGTHALTVAAVAYPKPTSPQQPQISMEVGGRTLEIPPLSGEGVRADGFGVKDCFL